MMIVYKKEEDNLITPSLFSFIVTYYFIKNNMLLHTIIIFLIVLTVYLHINYQLKKSNELEVYNIDFISKEQLEEISKLRQPFVFDYDLMEIDRNYLLKNYSKQNLQLKNKVSNDSVTLKVEEAISMMDKNDIYFSEKNNDLLNEYFLKELEKKERNIKPIFTGTCIYDMIMGSNKTYTPMRYEINHKNYFLVTEGKVKIRFAPPNCEKYLDPIIDYENLDITSQINIWNTKIEKIKFIDIIVEKGKMVFIPPYWWYSFEFIDKATIISFKYRTYMNIITIIPYLFIQNLQLQNVKYILPKYKTVKKKKGKRKNKEVNIT